MAGHRKLYGLIGYPLSHSFSAEYFRNKFRKEIIKNSEYRLFELQNLRDIRQLLDANPNLVGLNVTIPYKKLIINYLNSIDPEAAKIGAVNCLKIYRQQNKIKLHGYNTDSVGFRESITPLLKPHHQKALILGTGGSARAVSYTLKNLGMEILFVSRNPHDCSQVRYQVLNESIMNEYLMVVNTTPLGMYPNIEHFPDIPYGFITNKHLIYDLIYNPTMTVFLEKAMKKGATIKNGMEMLQLQAERSWDIWNAEVK